MFNEFMLLGNPLLPEQLIYDKSFPSIINEEDRAKLLKGEVVTKIGFEERFGRQIMGVIVPLLDEQRLEGVFYLYIPLASIQEITTEVAYIWIPIAFAFVFILLIAGKMMADRIANPLKEMEAVAYKMAHGDYKMEISIRSNDEIGRLAKAFNIMAKAIAEEDMRKKEFLANVSHELRTPLSYVKGYSDLTRNRQYIVVMTYILSVEGADTCFWVSLVTQVGILLSFHLILATLSLV
ncbi:HAMP domain-containing protein [Aeribacillus alveayuensis]|uniref:HAMP domain-containing protein n=1 Tax=Aeribacillus alveayuensis TaxID=279215 RepID=UPI000698DDC6|nr:HAMP domain-containing protein [Bacillus alveayuensis]